MYCNACWHSFLVEYEAGIQIWRVSQCANKRNAKGHVQILADGEIHIAFDQHLLKREYEGLSDLQRPMARVKVPMARVCSWAPQCECNRGLD